MLTILKIGGKLLENSDTQAIFCSDFVKINLPKVLVHGGGRTATQVAESMGIATQMIEGRRITSPEMLQVAVMVYAGLANKGLVAQLQALGCLSAGLCGADFNLIQAQKRPPQPIDYGLVGDVKSVNEKILENLLSQGVTPVIAPITHDQAGQLLNTNADTIASSLASALAANQATRLVFIFEKKGVLENIHDEESYIKTLNYTQYQDLRAAHIIHEGMVPKLENGFAALHQGVQEVIIGQLPSNGDIENMQGTRLVAS